MTERQLASVDVLKAASTDFCTMRHLAMCLRGLLRDGTVEALNTWLTDARSSNIHGMRRFARTVRQDMAAVTNAVLEPWSNGQAEGQINRLKMLKRAMYGRAGVDLLRARMFPFGIPPGAAAFQCLGAEGRLAFCSVMVGSVHERDNGHKLAGQAAA